VIVVHDYKIIKIYVLPAYSKQEALQKFRAAEAKHEEDQWFETQVVKLKEEPGWISGVKKQLMGK